LSQFQLSHDEMPSKPEHAATLARLRAKAPETFAPPAAKMNAKRDLVFEGATFRWEPKPQKPVTPKN